MSTIMERINESIKAFVLSELPAEYAEAPDLTAAKEELEGKLSKEQESLAAAWENANKVSMVYQFIGADAPSLMGGKPPIHKVLADSSDQLATRLAKLEEEKVKGLGQTLIDSAATASLLEKGFVGIESILKSLDGDLKKGDESDEAYKLVTKMLADLDEKAAADDAAEPSDKPLVAQLKNINAAQLGTDLSKVKKKIGTLYDSLVKMTLAYQEVHPPLQGLTSRQVELAAAITALAEDLSTKTTSSVKLAATDLAALNAKKEEIRSLGLVDASRVPAGPEEATAEGSTSSPEEETGGETENNPEVTAPAGSALKQLDKKLTAAKETLEKNAALKLSYEQTIADLKEALAAKQAHNAKIEVHLTALGGTKEAVASLKTQIESLEQDVETLVKELKELVGVVKKGTTGLADTYRSEMAKLDTVYGALAGLNGAISKADFNSDIKEYFGKAVARLDGLVEGATKLMGHLLLIEHAVGDLSGWAGGLKETITEVQASVKKSALSFKKAAGQVTADGDASPPSINSVIEELENQLLKDEELIAPKGAFPAGEWAGQFPGRATTLAEWQAFFEAELGVLAEDNKVQEQTIAFLTQLRPAPAAA